MSTAVTHQIVLDTETTGMNRVSTHYESHKVIEIDAVEVVNRRLTGNNFRVYLKPDRLVDPGAFDVHGIANEFLLDKPTFAEVTDELMGYIHGAESAIHNAAFDIGFMDYKSSLPKHDIPKIDISCEVTGSLAVARRMSPGKRNSLGVLCTCYEVDNSKRTLHGALLDAQIPAEVYLVMIGGQTSMVFTMKGETQQQRGEATIQRAMRRAGKLCIVFATDREVAVREARLGLVQKRSGSYLWRAQMPVKGVENNDLGNFCGKRSKR